MTGLSPPSEPSPTCSIITKTKSACSWPRPNTAIEWADDSAHPDTIFAASVEAFRGKQLDANNFVAFLNAFGANPEPQASGLELKVIKDENLTGVLLKIRLLSGKAPTQEWNFNKWITLDGKTIHRSGGGDLVGRYSEAGSAVNFTEAVATALAARPETPFEIWFHISASH
jgi:hypothetical protein